MPSLRTGSSQAAGNLGEVSKTFVGSRVRQLRNERGFSQAALAQMLEISPSYLNQIEHDVRPLTVAVLLRITEVFGVDATFFSSQDDTRLVAELREVTMDRDLDIDVDPTEVAEMVSAHPGLARAVVNLHRRYRITTAQLAAATEERFSDGSGSGSITMPHEEVRDYFYQRQNYLHELDTAAEDLTIKMRLASRRSGPRADPPAHRGARGAHQPADRSGRHRAAPLRPQDQDAGIQQSPVVGSAGFQDGRRTGLPRVRRSDRQLWSRRASSPATSRTRWRGWGLANYFAAAAVLPYRQFHDVAENFRYDVERLSSFYSISYETIAHRLSTLQRPSMRGVPFSFVRVDRAGNMSKRQSATGFHFSSSGGTCPLWNVYETFANPGKILVQIAQMPDGRNYMWVARTVERRAARYGQPGKTFAIGLGCELRHAHRLVYSEGLDVSGEPGTVATPIGAGCRVCERDNCPQRAFPALGRALDLDEHRSTVSPYLVTQP